MKKGEGGWLAPAVMLVCGILALAYGGGALGTVIGTGVPCYMTSATTCEAYKAGGGQLHTLLTHEDNNIPAIPEEEYDYCDITINWELPVGRYGDAYGSGTFTLTGLHTVSHQGILGCPVDPSGHVVTIREAGQDYEVTFGQLGLNMDWYERATFYAGVPPECYTSDDCQPGFICIGGSCIQENPPEEECYNDADCPEGYLCNTDNECELEPVTPPPIEGEMNPMFIALGLLLLVGGGALVARR